VVTQPIQYIAVFGIDARAGKVAGPIEGADTEAPQPFVAAAPAPGGAAVPGMPQTGGGPDAGWSIALLAGLLTVMGGLAVRLNMRRRADENMS
jgi:hypothetical protein